MAELYVSKSSVKSGSTFKQKCKKRQLKQKPAGRKQLGILPSVFLHAHLPHVLDDQQRHLPLRALFAGRDGRVARHRSDLRASARPAQGVWQRETKRKPQFPLFATRRQYAPATRGPCASFQHPGKDQHGVLPKPGSGTSRHGGSEADGLSKKSACRLFFFCIHVTIRGCFPLELA